MKAAFLTTASTVVILCSMSCAMSSSMSSARTAVQAKLTIEQLIEETGVEAGTVALRDVPGWRKPKKIVVRDVGPSVDDYQRVLPGVEIVIVSSAVDAAKNAAGADAIIGWCTNDAVSAAKDAVWVQVFSAGAEHCFTDERIVNKSIVLTNMQKMAAPVIAEHVIAMTLSLARGLPQFAKGMSDGEWLRTPAYTDGMQSIAGKTMLVVGLGGIGTEVARRAAALGMRVVGTRRSSHEGPEFVEYVGLSDELFELAGNADFVVNALPLTTETTDLFDAAFFAAAKSGAHFVNVGRGRSVVTADLLAALETGQIAGAALDVTEPEPLPADHALWQMDNVIITPHVSSRASNRDRRITLLMENLKRFNAGDALLNVVDPALGY